MPFIPHTKEQTRKMLDEIGIGSLDQLFSEVPDSILLDCLPTADTRSPERDEGMNEREMLQLFADRARNDGYKDCFLGGGAYLHHIPAAVWDLATRGEYLTCYTPYQAEASQGTLQVIYEFQSMVCHLTGMDVANASVYDGASALAEAVLMAIRANKKNSSNKVLIAGTINPSYLDTVQSIVGLQGIKVEVARTDENKGIF